jgi:RNA polymerase sigma-70 factor, Bacteroides expansion family 1
MDERCFIEKLNQRDIKAYHSLYESYYKSLVSYSSNFVLSMEAAEDIVQDLFAALWERRILFQSFNSLKCYLYNSIRNASLNYLKHQDVEAIYIESLANTYNEIEENEVYEEEVYRRLFVAIDKLSPRCREIFKLYMQGKKNEEIADMLGIAFETVKTQKKRAMQILRKEMGTLFFLFPLADLLN